MTWLSLNPASFRVLAGATGGIALINTIGNIAGFATPYITGVVKDATGFYELPMFVAGGSMLVSALLAFSIGAKVKDPAICA
ncbi:hypothetical protein [Sinorhizobium numidicum]|uniref:hypothetical protein n=1 Tax=Sinorhizobium numidicum TaxID=680248 RepID=UPI003CC864E1